MWRPAVSRLGAMLSLAFVACWSGQSAPPATPVAMQLEPAAPDITGPYWCSIDQDGYDYPRYACMIKKVGNKLMLAKLGGSQRVRGDITLDAKQGFTFDGELYCPWGDCTEPMRGKFKPNGRGGFRGELFNPAQRDEDEEITDIMTLTLTPAPQNAFGGAGYGGDGYGDPFGGRGYGGYGYGGQGYGRRRYPRRPPPKRPYRDPFGP